MTATIRVHALVRSFHERLGLPRHDHPTIDPDAVPAALLTFRLELLDEERDELALALDGGDLVAVADALADLVFVAYGTAVTLGVDLDPVVEEVARSNLTKDGVCGGKAVKGPGYQPPDVAAVLARQAARPPAAAAGHRPDTVTPG